MSDVLKSIESVIATWSRKSRMDTSTRRPTRRHFSNSGANGT